MSDRAANRHDISFAEESLSGEMEISEKELSSLLDHACERRVGEEMESVKGKLIACMTRASLCGA